MVFNKILIPGKLFLLKIKFGNRMEINSFRQNICLDTEIVVKKNAFLSLNRFCAQSNVHLLCVLGEMYIGSGVSFDRNCIVNSRYKIKIGDNCLFGPNVCVYDNDHVYNVNGVSPSEFNCSEIIIEAGCWIGAGVTILRGTHIGKNSIIEARAVIKGDIPPNSLVTTVKETRIIPTTLFLGKHMPDKKHHYQ